MKRAVSADTVFRGARIPILVGVLFLIPLSPAGQASASPEEMFKKGIAAADLKRYEQAAEWLRRAIEEDSRESERQVFISGVFSAAYLPHYHLGRVLLLGGESGCEEALGAFEESSRQGVVKKFARQAADLDAGRKRCADVVWPRLLTAAEAAIAGAVANADQLEEPFPDVGDETERRAALAQVDLATRRLAEARGSRDATKAATAADLAREGESRLAKLLIKLSASKAFSLATTEASSRQALAEAQEARRSLARRLEPPEVQRARREDPERFRALDLPEDVDFKLEDLQRRFAAARDREDLEGIRQEASTLGTRLRTLDADWIRALAEHRSARLQAAESRREREAELSRPPAVAVQVPTIDASEAESSRADEPTDSDPQLVALLDVASELLARVGDSSGRLLEAQRLRLTQLVEGALGDQGSEPAFKKRLAASYTALQVIAGGEALFAGRAEEALEILSSRALPADRLGAQGLLLRAVALHRLAQVDDQRSTVLLERASRDLNRFRVLKGSGPPVESRFFSRGFWRFFADVTVESATG